MDALELAALPDRPDSEFEWEDLLLRLELMPRAMWKLPLLAVHERLMESLTERGDLDRELEFLPTASQVTDLLDEGRGLTSPELAVLLAYSKMALKEDLLESDLPDDPATERQLRTYFPGPLRDERFAEDVAGHPLRREIVTTAVANDLVNRGGITFVQRAGEETSATPVQIARAFLVSREVFGLDDFVARVEALDNVVPTQVQTRLYLEFRRLMDRSVRWFLASRPGRLQPAVEIERFAEVGRLAPMVPDFLDGSQADRLRQVEAEGCAFEEGPSGLFVRTTPRKETTVPGVFAAGDSALAAHNASFASADGVMAGVAAHQSLALA